MLISRYFLITGMLLLTALPATSQDTRTVDEPRIPASCTTLTARLAAPHGVLTMEEEGRLDTTRIQQAIDHCHPGKAVVLAASGDHRVFLSGPLELRSGVVLVVSQGTVLAASRDPRLYDLTPGSCGVVNEKGHGCKPLITADHALHSGVMGNGAIDGRGGAKLLGEDVSWWDLAHQAKVANKQQSVPWLLVLHHADDFVLYRITLRNAPMFHVSVGQTDGFTAWGVKIMTPATARNTDGIDPSSSRNVTIAHSFIHTGDDNIALKSSESGATSNISILDNHFYTGHGMSIGSGTSGGVDHVLIDTLTIDGADNGIRIKSDRSRGGLVHDVLYRNVCMRAVRNPLVFTPAYTALEGSLLPTYRDITLRDVTIEDGERYTLQGLDAEHPLEIAFDNVFVHNLSRARIIAAHLRLTTGPRRGNLAPPVENDVAISEPPQTTPGLPLDCSASYLPFPANEDAPALAATAPEADQALYVAQDGSGEFSSIQQAVDAAPATGARILIAPGVYREVVTVDKPHIEMRGADASRVVVVNDLSAGTSGGTLHSATVNVTADDFVAEDLTIENDFNRTHPQLPVGSQAVALLVIGDRAVFRRVRLLGNQDTVYAGSRNCAPDGPACISARQYFADCLITGNVDFIFGDGKAVFDHCEIRSTAHRGGYLTAQSKHYSEEDSGFVFDHCKLTADAGAETPVYLGRPWRPYSYVVFLHTEMGAHIDPAGWREWHPGETHSLDTSYYAEFDSRGPGGSQGARDPHTHFLTAAEARAFEPEVFLAGGDHWNPAGANPTAPAESK